MNDTNARQTNIERALSDPEWARLRAQVRRRRRHLAFLSVAVPAFVFVMRATIFVLEVLMYTLTAVLIVSTLKGRRR